MEKSLEKMMNKLEKVLLPIANKLTSTKWLMAVKDTMITAMPFLIMPGSATTIISTGWSE